MASLTKPLYFTDETVALEVVVDNTRGEDAIDSITATLQQTLSIRQDKWAQKDQEMKARPIAKYVLMEQNLGKLESGQTSGLLTAEFNISEVSRNLNQI